MKSTFYGLAQKELVVTIANTSLDVVINSARPGGDSSSFSLPSSRSALTHLLETITKRTSRTFGKVTVKLIRGEDGVVEMDLFFNHLNTKYASRIFLEPEEVRKLIKFLRN